MPAITSPVDVQFDAAAHRYSVDGKVWPGVTGILRAVGLSTDFDRLPADRREAALRKRELGSHVHLSTAALDRRELEWDSVDANAFAYVEAWERYVRERGIIDWLAIEAIVAHPLYRYAGTVDRIGELGSNVYVVPDIKLGDPDDAGGAFQTAAYVAAAQYQFSELQTARVERECVQLLATGFYRVSPYPSRDDWKVFQAALVVYSAQPTRR